MTMMDNDDDDCDDGGGSGLSETTQPAGTKWYFYGKTPHIWYNLAYDDDDNNND